MARIFMVPKHIINGVEALVTAGSELKLLGHKALIVTDEIMITLGNCAQVEAVLKQHHIDYAVYAGICGEPTDIMIRAGAKIYTDNQCDFIIGLGGGSAIDSMKAIALMVQSHADIDDYLGKEITAVLPPMAAIPTTAGTGSEATQFTIITDTQRQIKMLLKGKSLLPDLAIIDPVFTMTAPPKITAATGIDALCHAVEAFTSKQAQPLSDTFALSAVSRIFQSLPKAFKQGNDVNARVNMSLAALEAGIAFNNASVTLIHGLSRPIGALFHIPHGLSNAMLIKPCLEFALSGAAARFALLGRLIKVADFNDRDETAGVKFIEAVESLTKELEIQTLAQFGVSKDKFMQVMDKMADDALDSGSPQNTRRVPSKDQILEIYRKLWD